jgi:5-formyltetrahydrofolate cyclo-ligase
MNENIKELKKEIRAEMKKRLAQISSQESSLLSEQITQLLYSTTEWQRAALIFAYCATSKEVQTDRIIKEAFRNKKRVCVPVFMPEIKEYRIALIYENTIFKNGYYNIKEPAHPEWLEENEKINLALVPGLAFDELGIRLGRGGGYYDKLLKLKVCTTAYRVGLFFNFQRATRLPSTQEDVPLNAVITDEKIFYFNK